MTYTVLENFKFGMDTRKLTEATRANAMPLLEDCHINKGGEIEQRGEWNPIGTLDADGIGLYSSPVDSDGNNTLIVVGTAAEGDVDNSAISDVTVAYHQIVPTGVYGPLERIFKVITFRGSLFVAARFIGGGNRYFYDGDEILDHPDAGGQGEPVLFSYKQKVYVGVGGFLYFSAINDATFWEPLPDDPDDPVGAGFIEVSAYDADCTSITGIAVYRGNVAILFHRAVQFWFISTEDTDNRYIQTLKSTGMIARQSLVQYGDDNAYYMSYDGIRTLKSRQISDSYYAFDAGTPIDNRIFEVADLDDRRATIGFIEPQSGRVWFIIGMFIFVYTEYPSAEIKGWSFYNLPGEIDYVAEANGKVYLRSGNTLYKYDEDTYDNGEDFCVIQLPWLTGNKPADLKDLTFVDIVSRGEWEVKAYVKPEDAEQYVDLGILEGNTLLDGADAGLGKAPQISLEFTSRPSGIKSVLSSVVFHYAQAGGRE